MRGIIVKTDNTYEVIEYENTLDALQEIVEGYIEYVTIDRGLAMIVNEEGLLRGMDYNKLASRFYAGPCIVGNALIVGTKFGENISLTDEQIELIINRLKEN